MTERGVRAYRAAAVEEFEKLNDKNDKFGFNRTALLSRIDALTKVLEEQ